MSTRVYKPWTAKRTNTYRNKLNCKDFEEHKKIDRLEYCLSRGMAVDLDMHAIAEKPNAAEAETKAGMEATAAEVKPKDE